MMQAFKTAILVTSLVALAGCAGLDKSSIESLDFSPICPKTHGWMPWPDARCDVGNAPKDSADLEKQLADRDKDLAAARKQLADRDREIASLRSGAGDSSRLASQLSSVQGELNQSKARVAELERRIADLERQLADRDKELSFMHSKLSDEMTKLKEAQRGLIRALRPQIAKGDITVDLNNERLLINLASSYLFGSGQDEMKPAGVDALKQVGVVLKDYQEYKVAVDGHTDNVPIRGELKKKFPTNKELSEARAAHAAQVLTESGLGAATTHGYADTQPVEPNTTASGRAKNRRVEVRVTK
jgi:chemotaxis protein MotB